MYDFLGSGRHKLLEYLLSVLSIDNCNIKSVVRVFSCFQLHFYCFLSCSDSHLDVAPDSNHCLQCLQILLRTVTSNLQHECLMINYCLLVFLKLLIGGVDFTK